MININLMINDYMKHKKYHMGLYQKTYYIIIRIILKDNTCISFLRKI